MTEGAEDLLTNASGHEDNNVDTQHQQRHCLAAEKVRITVCDCTLDHWPHFPNHHVLTIDVASNVVLVNLSS
jgi:hypothetical protein